MFSPFWGGRLVPIWHILAYNILLCLSKIFLGGYWAVFRGYIMGFTGWG